MSKIQPVENDPQMFLFFCPGCECSHYFTTKIWTFNGDLDKPTVRNSVLIHEAIDEAGKHVIHRCHSFVTAGQIEFLGDCTHTLAGQTVELPDYSTASPC